MNQHPDWHGKPYYSLDAWCKNTYGRKLYKAALDIGCTCPNRDGTLGYSGCIFCSAGGSGDFAAAPAATIEEQLQEARALLHSKWKLASPAASSAKEPRLIAYFQSYTNTYGDPKRLGHLFAQALLQPDVAGISIATRPDCLSDEILVKLSALKTAFPDKFIWIELGLQTIHDRTAEYIRRGYPTEVFEQAMRTLSSLGFPVIVHTILGLPGESRQDMLMTIDSVNRFHPFGIKLQLLHILKGTVLDSLYAAGQVNALSKEEYIGLLAACIAALSPDICVHRITGDGPAKLLTAPLWSLRKRDVLNSIHSYFKQNGIRQGICFDEAKETSHDTGTIDTL